MTYFDRKGNEIDLIRFGQLWEDISYRKVKEDEVGDYTIKTYWMGVDPYYTKKSIKDIDLPQIFESRIFCKKVDDLLHLKSISSYDEYSCLYAHDKLCELCRPKKLPPGIISSDEHIERATQQDIKNKKVKK